MKKYSIIGWAAVLTCILWTTACGSGKDNKQKENIDVIDVTQNMPGDSTVYGLACDGCNDTILVFLPRKGGDPDTFNILNASKQRKVFGRPMIGDKMAVVVNRENPKVADMVIDLEELKGEWCYQVKPQLRERAGMSMNAQQLAKIMEVDSVFRKMMEPREYGLEIKSEHVARPIGMTYAMTSDEESPVIYPQLNRYREWLIFNGQLILNETRRDTTGAVTVINSDTAKFILLRRDTLVIEFTDGKQQGYYRKTEES